MSRTEYLNKYRKEHPVKRNKDRMKNYTKSRPQIRKHRPWTPYEIDLIINGHSFLDREIAERIGRSVQAIQQRRWKLKNGEKIHLAK